MGDPIDNQEPNVVSPPRTRSLRVVMAAMMRDLAGSCAT
jgi:hypothetical protein